MTANKDLPANEVIYSPNSREKNFIYRDFIRQNMTNTKDLPTSVVIYSPISREKKFISSE